MNPYPESHFANEEEKTFWIENVISDFQEGIASHEDIEKLHTLMLADPEARRIYRESNELTLLLEEARIPTAQEKKKPSIIFRWATGIAAVLATGLWLSPSRDEAPASPAKKNPWLASLSSSHEAKWESPENILGRFKQGEIKLLSGVAELEFKNGAQIVIEGPCELEIIDHDSVELVSGKLWGHCPPSAHGFEVLAPGGNRIIDLGTRFGIGATPSGSVDVHVFDGEVEVFQSGEEKRALKAGAGVQFKPGEKPLAINADFERFTDAEELQRERWQDHHEAMLARDDLHFYYDFAPHSFREGSLTNQAAPFGKGQIKGAVQVNGRIPGKSALLFEKTGDSVGIDLTDLQLGDGFTIAMWIKPTDFSRSHMALLNSNGFESGDIHFQIHDDGRLMTGISETTRYASPRGTIQTNVWQLVTVSWDLKTKKAQLFLDGQALRNIQNKFPKTIPDATVNFGKCHIGTWAKPTYGHNRSFVGRIDEVMIFSSPLGESEVEQLYESSRP